MGCQGISGNDRIGYLSTPVLLDVGKFCEDMVVRVPLIDFFPQVARWMSEHIEM